MQEVKITVPKGTVYIETPGVNAIFPGDTDVVFEVHDAELLAHETEDPFDVAAHSLAAANRADLIPLLKHKGEDAEKAAVTVSYTAVGRRVEQSKEEVSAAQDFADGPDLGTEADIEAAKRAAAQEEQEETATKAPAEEKAPTKARPKAPKKPPVKKK